MKQLLFLLLFPCLALAQYQGNANQKITLGEQTTADGLVYRGVASIDTVTATNKITRANKQDTSAYILLDTVTNLLWHYKIGSNAWTQAGGSTFDTTTLNLTSRFALKLNVADTSSIAYVNTYGTQTVNGGKTFTSTVTGAKFIPTGNSASGNGMYLPGTNTLGFSTNGTNRMTLDASGNVLIGTTTESGYKLDVNGTLRVVSGASPSIFNTATGQGIAIENSDSSNKRYRLNVDGTSFIITEAGVGTPLTIAAGGAATFSSSVTAVSVAAANGRFTAVGEGTFANNLNITSDGTLTTATSDEKYKYNILPINYGLNTILQLKPVNFQWIEGEEQDLGFIAQDVADIIPEAVNTNWNSDLLMRYESIIPILTKAIQEQNALIKALEQRIINLENK